MKRPTGRWRQTTGRIHRRPAWFTVAPRGKVPRTSDGKEFGALPGLRLDRATLSGPRSGLCDWIGITTAVQQPAFPAPPRGPDEGIPRRGRGWKEWAGLLPTRSVMGTPPHRGGRTITGVVGARCGASEGHAAEGSRGRILREVPPRTPAPRSSPRQTSAGLSGRTRRGKSQR